MSRAVRRWLHPAALIEHGDPATTYSVLRHSHPDAIEVEIRPVQAEEEKRVGNPMRYWLSGTGREFLFADVRPAGDWTELFPWKQPDPPPAAGMKRGWLRKHPDEPNWRVGALYDNPTSDCGYGKPIEIEYRYVTPPPTPARCVCEAEAEAQDLGDDGYYVRCTDEPCWCGPAKDSRAEAISAWNEIMERAK